MYRHLARLADQTFDAVVIGGGVYGLSTALALIQRGLSVALVERRDFGGATSFNSLKTVHGGIRSLQRFDLADTREFVRERRAMATMAPHLVRVLPFVVPTAWHPIRNRLAMAAFFLAYDLAASDRNEGLDRAVHLPASYTVGRSAAVTLNPLVDATTVHGGAVWHDYQLHSPERFIMALARTIEDAGGVVANYIEADRLLENSGRIQGVHVKDALTGDAFDVRASAVVNAAGPWSWKLLESFGRPTLHHHGFSLALNLVVDRPPLAHAVGGIAQGRFLFLVPWGDRSILGTSHEGFHQQPVPSPTAADVDALLRDGQAAFPAARLDHAAVRLVHRGLLPASRSGTAHGALLKRSLIVNHAAHDAPGLVSVVGVRYTTARASAQAAAEEVCNILGKRSPGIARPQPLAGASFGDLTDYLASRPTDARLITRYGTHYTELPPSRVPIAPGVAITDAELLYAVRSEMAITLADAVLRRTHLAAGGHPGADVLRAAAAVLATELGWSDSKVEDEIQQVEREIASPAATRPA